jgi:hypothetical protein
MQLQGHNLRESWRDDVGTAAAELCNWPCDGEVWGGTSVRKWKYPLKDSLYHSHSALREDKYRMRFTAT